jgi:ATP-binding cassette subfamily B multidrug efflux pump
MDDLDLLLKNPVIYYIKKNKRPFFVGLSLLVFNNFIDCLTPIVLKMAIDYLAKGIYQPVEIFKISGMFFSIMATLAITRYGWRVFWGQFHTLSAEDLRNRIFNQFTVLGPKFFNKNPIGELMSLITNDVQSFRNGIGPGLLILVDGISLIAIIVPMMIYVDFGWTWKCLILMPLVPFIISFIMKKIWHNYKDQQDRLSEMTGYTQEIISGIRTIKTFSQELNKTKLFNIFSKKYEEATNRMNLVDAFFNPIMQLSVATGTIILFYVGGTEVISGIKTVGSFIAFQRYINKIIWPMSALGFGFSQFQKGMASFSRIKNQLKEIPEFINDEGKEIKEISSIEVKNLSFSYDKEIKTLQDINFKMVKGDFLGIVGSVGSGKSTLINLLCKYLDPTSGVILLNGEDYNVYKYSEIWKNIKLVPQESFLFSETVRNNILYGHGSVIPNEEILLEKTIDQVGIKNEILSLPEAFESQLGERGVNLSGGQKQRLALARGLILHSPVLLLDDTLSAVDAETEEKIQNELYQANPNQIRIVITHRLKTVGKANQIIVLEKGRIEAMGTHLQLLETSKIYRQMADLQGAFHMQDKGLSHE